MRERSGIITMGGNPVTLVGNEVKVGDAAPDFEVVDTNLNPVKFSSFRGKVRVILSVPSLDTPVCDLEAQRFDSEIESLPSDVEVLTISMDLPFAQKRWCGARGVKKVKTFSDHRDASFGLAYGVLIKEVRLLARAIFIVDGESRVRYVQLVEEVTHEPDYESVLNALKELQ